MNPTQHCPLCGASLTPQAAGGLCPKCLLIRGLMTTLYGGDGPMVPPEPQELAALFPDLEILELLGHGGMGVVYKARQPRLERLVALKILPVQLDADPTFRERFLQEARALAKLNHPGIVRVYDSGGSEGMFHLIMEYVEGVDLAKRLRAGRILPQEAVSIVGQVCEALDYAHQRGVVHRDIKPANILVTPEGRVKLADFGVAKLLGPSPAAGLTLEGDALGTPLYMAPEQREKPEGVDSRADLYSLGVVFYEMLTGELPTGNFPKPSERGFSPEMDEPVLRALETEPAKRYQRASELRSAVEHISTSSGEQPAETASEVPTPRRRGRPRGLLAAGAVLLLLVVGTVAGLWWWQNRKPDPKDLFEAAQFGDVSAITKFLDAGADVNARDGDGNTALAYASAVAEPAAVKLLLERKARPNAGDHFGMTPIVLAMVPAALRGEASKRTMELLLAHGADVHGTPEPMPEKPLSERLQEVQPTPQADAFYRQPLAQAVMQGDTTLVQFLLEHGADVKRKAIGDGRSLLHIMGNLGRADVIEEVQKGWETLPQAMRKRYTRATLDTRKASQLVIASRNVAPLLDLLLQKGLDIEGKEADLDMTPLNLAAWEGRTSAVKALLDRGAKLETTDKAGFTPLLSAAEKGHFETVELLVARGANLEAVDLRGGNALSLVVDKIRPDDTSMRLASLLLDKGLDVDVAGTFPMPPLMRAAQVGHHRMVKLLLERHAKVDARLDKSGSMDDGTSALHWACLGPSHWKRLNTSPLGTTPGVGGDRIHFGTEEDFLACVRLLIDAGADPKARSVMQATPLHSSAQGDTAAIAELLLTRGAELEAVDIQSRTPLFWTASSGSPGVLRVLLKHGAKQVMPGAEITALHHAAPRGHVDVMQILLDAGGDVNAFDEKGATALHLAASEGHVEAVRLLLARGADIHAEDTYGSTPLGQAAIMGRREIVDILLAAKANPSHISLGGINIPMAARMREHKELADYLGKQIEGYDFEIEKRLWEAIQQASRFIQVLPNRVQPEAEPPLREELSLLEKLLGNKSHPAIVVCRGTLGLVLEQTGRDAEAIPLLQEATKLLAASPKTQKNPLLAGFLRSQADACSAAGRSEEQLSALRDLRALLARGVLKTANPKGPGTPTLTEGGLKPESDPLAVAEVDREVGAVLVTLGRGAEAEEIYRKAKEVLERAHGGAHPSVVEIQDVLEQLGRAAGRPVKPRNVGGFARVEKLLFEGNTTFTAEALRKGLRSSPDFLLAAHPSGRFDDYLKSLAGCLTRGYQKAGFPDAKATAEYDVARDAVVARITEGQRYRWGTLRVTGAEKTGNEALREHLLKMKEPEDTFGRRWSKNFETMNMGGWAKEEDDGGARVPVIQNTATFADSWREGDFASFGASAESGLAGATAGGLVSLGYFKATAKVRHTLRPEALTVDTELEVTEGPRAMLRKIEIKGNKMHSREQLLAFLNLKEGVEAEPGLKAVLDDKLARCLRFASWSVQVMQAALDSADVDLRLKVEEMPGAPPLDKPLSAEQEAMVQLAEWVTMLDQSDEVLEVGWMDGDPNTSELPLRMLWCKEGFHIHAKAVSADAAFKSASLSLSADAFTATLDNRKEQRAWTTQVGGIGQLEPLISLSTTVHEGGIAGGDFFTYLGFGTPKEGMPALQMRLALMPTEILRMATLPGAKLVRATERGVETVTLETDRFWMMWAPKAQKVSVIFYAEDNHGMDVSVRNVEPQEWTKCREELRAELAGSTHTSAGLSDWVRMAQTVWDILSKAANDDGTSGTWHVTGEQVAGWAVLGDLLADAGVSISDIIFPGDTAEFYVPMELGEVSKINPTAMLMSNLWFYITDSYFPKDTWLWELGRELFYIQAGRAEHTPAVLARIAKDPGIGPYGCLVGHKLLELLKAPQAMAFQQLAWEKLTAEGFRRDWKMLMEHPSGLRDSAQKVMARLRSLDDAKVESLLALLGEDMKPLLRNAIAEMRAHPEQPVATLLWPLAQKAWDSQLEKTLRTTLEQIPGVKPADATKIAARVNGVEITRADYLDAIESQQEFLNLKYKSNPTELQKQMKTVEAVALDALIERELVLQAFKSEGGELKPGVLDQDIQAIIRGNFQSEAKFLAELKESGMTMERFRQQREKAIILQAMRDKVISEVREPTEPELRAAYEKESGKSAGARRVELHTLSIPQSHVDDKKAAVEGQRKLAQEIRGKIAGGADFQKMAKSYSMDSRAEQGGSWGFVDPNDFAPEMKTALLSMKAGGLSEVIEVGGSFVILWVKSEKAAAPPTLTEMRETFGPRVFEGKKKQAVERWIEQLRARAHIEKFSLSSP